MSNVKENILMIKLGLGQDKDPIDAFYENPCEFTLSRIGKTQQTEGMVWLAVEHEKKICFLIF